MSNTRWMALGAFLVAIVGFAAHGSASRVSVKDLVACKDYLAGEFAAPAGSIQTPLKYGSAFELDLSDSVAYKTAHAQLNQLSPVHEYGITGTVLLNVSSLTFDGYRNFEALLKHLPPEVRLVLYGSKESYHSFYLAYSYMELLAARPDNSTFYVEISAPTDGQIVDKWSRDHLGIPVAYVGRRGAPLIGYVSAHYRFGYEPNEILRSLGIQKVHQVESNFEWGNYIQIGNTAYVVDGPRLPHDFNLDALAYAGIRSVVVLPQPKYAGVAQGLPHADEFIMAVSDKDVVTNDPEYAKYFSKVKGLNVHLVPNNADLAGDYSLLSYTNVLIVNSGSVRQIYMSRFSEGKDIPKDIRRKLKIRDRKAEAVYRSLGFEVIGISSADFNLRSYGGLHCATSFLPPTPNADLNPAFFRGAVTVMK